MLAKSLVSTVEKYICDLLYDHDCVIVPSLGGFLASNISAKINPSQQTVYPPRRKIAFNIYLRQNDGLLANHLAKAENLPYPEAVKKLDSFVSNVFTSLDSNNKFIFEHIGTLYYDKDRHLLFEPFRQSQFLREAFGLSPVRFLPLEKDDKIQRITSERKRIMQGRKSVPPERKTSRRFGAAPRILGVIAVAGAVLWLSFNLFLISSESGDKGSLNPFDIKESLSVKSEAIVPKPVEMLPAPAETVYVASTEALDKAPEVKSEIKPAVPEIKIQETVRPSASVEKYFVVAGAFKVPENAETFTNDLISKGFLETRLIRKGNLNYVCYDGFENRAGALAFLDSLRKQNAEGWIWKQ
ncbi:MAG: SPOR domain-containing protein [Bacteroidetes bacterium]|nr:MAG: SPOR domain-containing protein [Bacteroidota bacterium]REK00630.1 MAG: SPOR domain-containing protein [Bacteroidota bacterium]REK35248.1 MAG: SPOR domain-containing protein [Bacteroidota bacterium]REK48325.1 MAG: SPOR domain-containing protein [Bacteroidota bacterium]